MRYIEQIGAKLLPMDVINDMQVFTGVAQVIATSGHIDVLINNTGYDGYGVLEMISMVETHK